VAFNGTKPVFGTYNKGNLYLPWAMFLAQVLSGAELTTGSINSNGR